MPATKRPSEGTTPQAKKPHPFFVAGAKTQLGTFQPSPPTLIHFTHLDPFAPQPVASTSTASSSTSNKIAISFYDLDGTLIKPRLGGPFPKSRDDWMWWNPVVPERLKKEWEEGRHLVVISNQGDSREKVRNEWKLKLPLIAAKMPSGVPLRVLAALSMSDVYRKPNIGMFETISKVYRDQGLEIDMERSVFVGDAAGRMANGPQRRDHGDTDYKFALNTGLKFVTPEEHFLGHPRPSFPEPPNGFRPAKVGNLGSLPHIVPSHTPIARPETEIVLFVGPPASGKSSFFRKHFAPNEYEHVNQDLLGTRYKCLRVAEGLLREGKAVVIDNTNRNRDTRAHWINLASKLKVPVRVFHFLCPLELAKHNNMYRACYAPPNEPPRTLLPLLAFTSYAAAFEPPSANEGFDEVRGVNFHFEGGEEQRRKWDMYMLEQKR
ncbi:polynucleotide kinase 3'-phosphatase [Kwoniella shandongensis]|uniref:Polynucleotide kinase 3'-phosphatase n=1 Tax=Kwoniella shandongensis TaxID=1734106 RepID=A0A5M6C3D3_9TREE|nr:polynucleotide kinase 3'-phosphatase [Kwoniella shandongensis]KAA5529648.1 polynucleotide kinase 3'-phosphatase [Kwoniella shandongensis]